MILFCAFLFPLMMALMAFMVDIGHIFVARARLQNAADAGSLAAAHVLFEQRLAGSHDEDMSEAEREGAARTAAHAAAVTVQQDNVNGSGAAVEFGRCDTGGNFVVAPMDTPATAVRVTAYLNEDAPGGPLRLIFAAAIGIRTCNLKGQAVTQIAGCITSVLGGVSPFSVPEDRVPPPGESMAFFPGLDGDGGDDEGHGDNQVTSGNWGLLDLDGGANAASDLVDWIANGYDGVVTIDPDEGRWIEGTPGINASIKNAAISRIGDQIIMVVYDDVRAVGANTEYHCVGFLIATLTEVVLTGQPSNQRLVARVEGLTRMHGIVAGAGPASSPNIRKIQLTQ